LRSDATGPTGPTASSAASKYHDDVSLDNEVGVTVGDMVVEVALGAIVVGTTADDRVVGAAVDDVAGAAGPVVSPT
jgi:hypothetical protein